MLVLLMLRQEDDDDDDDDDDDGDGDGEFHGHFQDQSKLGWKLIDAALERFNKVIGAPGSGKNTLMCRVIMDLLSDSVSRYDNLVPLRLPILDLAKRSTDQVQAWFDKYLRILFGEDTPRYKMMKMAISMRRALFLFEGLDAAGQLREALSDIKAVEILIQGFVKEGHFLLMTSRRLPQGSSLEAAALRLNGSSDPTYSLHCSKPKKELQWRL
ncbi:hypothetical protein AK812_SmicGene814 [Symbiodinium microadriaticum]|uniref:NACHT domain-containing protein n=1 Tax=Symbiodinium microadriaticum TaxID=2951 RepID=A0A1Q9F5K7_SYMMI|nr:hypothetical protein AK812_SmicGene814 [Symbiodinium microadriaticum]